MPKLAQVFEHGKLAVGEQGLNTKQFDALVQYNDRHGCEFFKVGHNRLHFSQFVGVIQVGDLSIEILPKADKSATPDKRKWRNALLQMLRESGLLDVEAAPEADLHLKRSPLVDLYLDAFLREIERLSHEGLVKKYRVTQANLYKLKGRILFGQQVSRNLLHRERMYTAHEVYDRDNVFNRVLKCALSIVELLAMRRSLVTRAAGLGLLLESVSDSRITPEVFERLILDRNTERYRRAIQLARLIILNYSPDLRGGQDHVIAILFDMNKLFERFILVKLSQAQRFFTDRRLRIVGQTSRPFWASKSLRPDAVADFDREEHRERVIIDTKWKIPKDGQPSDDDLKQMYAYNLHFGSRRSVLLYPSSDAQQTGINQPYAPSDALQGYWHNCATYFVDLFDNKDHLRRDIGAELIQRVVFNEWNP
jgi:5-methylcytosine-specific restriction enzyme subunit McrC